jgi:hypothetical protein
MTVDRFFAAHNISRKLQQSGAKARRAGQRIYVAAKAATHKSHLKLGCVQQRKNIFRAGKILKRADC